MQLWIPAAIAFLVAGVLELMFLALSCTGVLSGVLMTILALGGAFRNEEALMGPALVVAYSFFLVITVIAGPLHVVVGVAILTGRRDRALLWAATIVSLLPVATVYCAPTSVAAGVLGLLAAILTAPTYALNQPVVTSPSGSSTGSGPSPNILR